VSEDSLSWYSVCPVTDVGEEDVIQFEHDGKLYAVYHTPSGFYATDGLCTHEQEFLVDGLVIGEIIECPRHQGRFHIPSGRVRLPPFAWTGQLIPPKSRTARSSWDLPSNSFITPCRARAGPQPPLSLGIA
jgi:3-phenylpropionate/trans-cinnamate dioxygenase ferredoxin subunit